MLVVVLACPLTIVEAGSRQGDLLPGPFSTTPGVVPTAAFGMADAMSGAQPVAVRKLLADVSNAPAALLPQLPPVYGPTSSTPAYGSIPSPSTQQPPAYGSPTFAYPPPPSPTINGGLPGALPSDQAGSTSSSDGDSSGLSPGLIAVAVVIPTLAVGGAVWVGARWLRRRRSVYYRSGF